MIYQAMVKLPLLVSSLLVATATDGVWWNTDGGSVTEQRDHDTVTCTMTLKGDDGQFEFAWSNKLPPRAVVEQKNWSFPSGYMWNVALRIGGTWLEHGDGTPNIPAMTGSTSIMFLLNQPIDDMLLAARDVAIKTPDRTFNINLAPKKIQALVAALHKCSALIGRPG
jgi:hypothetical protein